MKISLVSCNYFSLFIVLKGLQTAPRRTCGGHACVSVLSWLMSCGFPVAFVAFLYCDLIVVVLFVLWLCFVFTVGSSLVYCNVRVSLFLCLTCF